MARRPAGWLGNAPVALGERIVPIELAHGISAIIFLMARRAYTSARADLLQLAGA